MLSLSLLFYATREGDLPLIVAIDLQPMAPIEGVIQVQGDITNARTAEVVSWNGEHKIFFSILAHAIAANLAHLNVLPGY